MALTEAKEKADYLVNRFGSKKFALIYTEEILNFIENDYDGYIDGDKDQLWLDVKDELNK